MNPQLADLVLRLLCKGAVLVTLPPYGFDKLSLGTRCALLTLFDVLPLQIQGIASPYRLRLSILGLLGMRGQCLNSFVDVALAAGRGMIFGKKYNNRASLDGLQVV